MSKLEINIKLIVIFARLNIQNAFTKQNVIYYFHKHQTTNQGKKRKISFILRILIFNNKCENLKL